MEGSELQTPRFGFGCVNLEEGALFSSVQTGGLPVPLLVKISVVPLQT